MISNVLGILLTSGRTVESSALGWNISHSRPRISLTHALLGYAPAVPSISVRPYRYSTITGRFLERLVSYPGLDRMGMVEQEVARRVAQPLDRELRDYLGADLLDDPLPAGRAAPRGRSGRLPAVLAGGAKAGQQPVAQAAQDRQVPSCLGASTCRKAGTSC